MIGGGDRPAAVLNLWRSHLRAIKGEKKIPFDVCVGVTGSFTVDNLIPHIGGNLLQRGLKAPEVVAGPFNQIHQFCLDYKAVLGREDDLDVLVILWRLEDISSDHLVAALLQNESSFELIAQEIRAIAQSVAALRANYKGTLIVSNPPYPSLASFDLNELGQAGRGGALYQHLLDIWNKSTQGIEGIRAFDLPGLLMSHGYEAAHDARKWYLYRQPYSEGFAYLVGRTLAHTVVSGKIAAKKCLVLDADNTMWGGIVGEDGIGGIEVGNDYPGLAFRDFQKYALYLQKKGVMLAISSKNNEEDVLEVLDSHDAMVLRREHFSAMEINWNSKVEGLRNIARTLNIGTDALVFVDDNPKEIGEVQERLPEVTCVLVPEELAEFPSILRNSGLFDIGDLTKEDRDRTRMMAQEVVRKQAAEHVSEDAFREALGLKVKVFKVQGQHLARTAQLINKTNQFNLTTIRRTQEEVKVLCDSEDSLVLATEIEDRYGEYGLVGVAILTRSDEKGVWDIDTLLMSCRVLGRGADTAFLSKVVEAAARCGAQTVRGRYIPTLKNRMVEDLFSRHGFLRDSADTSCWRIDAGAEAVAFPGYIECTLSM